METIVKPRKTLIRFLTALAELYSEKMTGPRQSAYFQVLNDLSDSELKKAYTSIINNPWIKKLPLPGEIRNSAKPKLAPKDEAVIRINLIKDAIRKFGWCSPDEAKEFLGEVWNDVQNMGGWKFLCVSPDCNLNEPIIYAQKRDEVKSFIESGRVGISKEQLTSGNNKVMDLIDTMIKPIGGSE